jgi:hypothetical protein
MVLDAWRGLAGDLASRLAGLPGLARDPRRFARDQRDRALAAG